MSELRDAIKRYDEWVEPPDEADISTFVLAARRVDNPNIEAVALYLGLLTDYGISGRTIMALAEGAALAALTPGEPKQ